MPDAKGKMSLAERNAATDVINEKAKDPNDPCPHCGSPDSEISEFLVRLPVADDFQIPASAYVVAPVFCRNCGFVRLFDPDVLGLEAADKPEDSE